MKQFDEIIQKLGERAWKDEGFKKKLFADPKAVLKEMGYNIPDSMEVTIHENTPNRVNMVLPQNPVDMSLSDEQLNNISGGTGTTINTNNYTCCTYFDITC